MEIGFWKLLCKDGPHALPLKQRIPEVAIFRGAVLEACYFSNQRGFFLRRTGQDTTREAVLEHLLAAAKSRVETAGLGSDDEVAILRRPPSLQSIEASKDAPPVATVLTTSQLLDLLESADGYAAFGISNTEQWSLQSLVLPAEDLRSVAVYSRDALGQERIDVVGRSYQAMYSLATSSPWPGSANRAGFTTLAAVPETQLVAIEAKALAMVQYVQHFQQRSIEGLISEFVVDQSGRIILHAFWKVTFFDADVRPIPPDSMRADGFVCSAMASSLRGMMTSLDSSLNSSTTMPCGTDALMASCSTDTGWAGLPSRPTSATLSEQRQASRPGSAGAYGGSYGRDESPPQQTESSSLQDSSSSKPGMEPSSTRRAQSPTTRRPLSPTGSASPYKRTPSVQESQDLQILEDEDGGDDLDEAIERLQAARRPASRQRPAHAQRPRPKAGIRGTPPVNAASAEFSSPTHAPRSKVPRLLLEAWDGDCFLGETEIVPPIASTTEPTGTATTFELRAQHSPALRIDERKQALGRMPQCILRATAHWQASSSGESSLRLQLLSVESPLAGVLSDVASERLRAHLWICTLQAFGEYECRPVWSSCCAVKKETQSGTEGSDQASIIYEWDNDAVEVPLPKGAFSAEPPQKRRPCSARARIGSAPPPGTARARPASARGRIGAGSTSSLLQDAKRLARPQSPSNPSSAKPSRPPSAKPDRPAKPSSGRRTNARTACAGDAEDVSQAPPMMSAANGRRSATSTSVHDSRSQSEPKKTFHSNQLLSRYQMERDARTRLISVLTRQLERYRDLLPAWIEQRNAVRCVVSRMDQELVKRSELIDQLVMEKDQVEKAYTQKYDNLVRAMSREQERAFASAQAKKRELEASIDMEREATKRLEEEERKNANDRASLNQTLSQLNGMQVAIASVQAERQKMEHSTEQQCVSQALQSASGYNSSTSDAPQLVAGQTANISQAHQQNAFPSSEFTQGRGLRQDEIFVKEKERAAAEKQATMLQIQRAQNELSRQRENSARLEEFLRKVSSGSDGGYAILDPGSKREAAVLLAAAEKMRSGGSAGLNLSSAGRPGSPLRRSGQPSQESCSGRRCAACDENDVQWPPG